MHNPQFCVTFRPNSKKTLHLYICIYFCLSMPNVNISLSEEDLSDFREFCVREDLPLSCLLRKGARQIITYDSERLDQRVGGLEEAINILDEKIENLIKKNEQLL